jgi:hypothetical protein
VREESCDLCGLQRRGMTFLVKQGCTA